jgi:hypothetical protein
MYSQGLGFFKFPQLAGWVGFSIGCSLEVYPKKNVWPDPKTPRIDVLKCVGIWVRAKTRSTDPFW